jgi:hypothetical protein
MDDFDLNPDRAVPGDPPINAESMLEVLGESRELYQRRIDAARDLMVPYAIRALLDGADPRQVAHCCGFQVGQQVQQVPDRNPMESMMRSMGYTLFAYDDQPSNPMEAFATWVGDKLTEFVKERSN